MPPQGFPKAARLLVSRQFQEMVQGQKNQGRYLIVQTLLRPHSPTKLGITATRRFGPSVERNLFKRKIREAFRLVQDKIPPNLWIHVRPTPLATQAPMHTLQEELLKSIQDLSNQIKT